MVALLMTIRRSLAELDLGLKGDLTMSESMEKLMYALASDTVPQSWALVAYPSLRSLSSWLNNLVARAAQLSDWTSDFTVPKSVWLSGELLSMSEIYMPDARASVPALWSCRIPSHKGTMNSV